MKYLYLIIISITLQCYSFCQTDSIFLSYPSNFDQNAITTIISESHNGYGLIMLNLPVDTFSSFVLVDSIGVEQNRIEPLLNSPKGYFVIQQMEQLNDSTLFLIGYEYSSNSPNRILTFITTPGFENLEIIDEIEIPEGYIFICPRLQKRNASFLGLGYLREVNFRGDRLFENNIYFEINEDGEIFTFKELDFKFPDFINSFIEINDTLIINFFNKTTFILDSDLSKVDSFNIHYNGVINGEIIQNFYTVYGITQNSNGIFGLGQGISETSYNLSLIKFKNNLDIDTIYPALPFAGDDIQFSVFGSDSEGNFISVGTGFFPFFTQSYFPNILYVTKYDPFGNPIWYKVFNDTRMLLGNDMIIDENDDIVIVGEYQDEGFNGLRSNFLLKIFSDGSLSSINESTIEEIGFTVFPNPTTEIINFEIADFDSNLAEIYSVDGKLVYSESLQNGENSIKVDQLNSGIYFLTIKEISSGRFRVAKFQKE